MHSLVYCDGDGCSGERMMDAGGDAVVTAAESDDVMNNDALRDTYVDTLNLWVGCSTALLYAYISNGHGNVQFFNFVKDFNVRFKPHSQSDSQ